MLLKDRIRMQMEEAFGPVNRWYCSQHYGREVTDRETLIAYYIKHGGAEHFARRGRSTPQDSFEKESRARSDA